jgi:hypothetical protein
LLWQMGTKHDVRCLARMAELQNYEREILHELWFIDSGISWKHCVCYMYAGLMDIIVKNHLVKLVLADTCFSFEPFELCMSNSVR